MGFRNWSVAVLLLTVGFITTRGADTHGGDKSQQMWWPLYKQLELDLLAQAVCAAKTGPYQYAYALNTDRRCSCKDLCESRRKNFLADTQSNFLYMSGEIGCIDVKGFNVHKYSTSPIPMKLRTLFNPAACSKSLPHNYCCCYLNQYANVMEPATTTMGPLGPAEGIYVQDGPSKGPLPN
ncbi:hypothetical protein ScPMuIL_011116 [Solemya velum]